MIVLAGISMTAGLILALLLGRALASVAFGIPASDPLVLTTTLAGFAVVTVISAWLPARRASRIDPLAALRSD
jgi:putative ABC transport system permease protein